MAEDSTEQVEVGDAPPDEVDQSQNPTDIATDEAADASRDVAGADDTTAAPQEQLSETEAGQTEPSATSETEADETEPSETEPVETEPSDSEQSETEAGEADSEQSVPARRFSRSQVLIGSLSAVAVLSMVGGWTWWFLADHHGVPENGIQTALDYLDQRNAQDQALHAALVLKKAGFRDQSFPGAASYVLGIATFRKTQSGSDTSADKHYRQVVEALRNAKRHLVPESRQPELAYALGVSLFELEEFGRARKWLEDAVETYARGRVVATLRLIDIYVDSNDSVAFRKAQRLNAELKNETSLTPAQEKRRRVQEVRTLLAVGDKQQTQAAIQTLFDESDDQSHWELTLIHARALMSAGEMAQAMDLLSELRRQPRMDEWLKRRAAYLVGLCHERQGHVDAAISEYKQTVRSYRETQEGAAASLAAADLLRGKQRDEEAILAYKTALTLSRGPGDFYNRWIAFAAFRKRIERAWNSWVENEQFAEAIELTVMMPPLFDATEAQHLKARANELWAEHLEQKMLVAPYRNYAEQIAELRSRWRESGLAYAKLSELRSESTTYSAICLKSAEHLAQSHDFENALQQLSLHLQSAPTPSIAAQVLLGEIYLNQDNLDQAIRVLHRVLEAKTTDPAIYQGQLLLGRCFIEKHDWDQAESVWRAMIDSNQLGPTALEWRLVRMEQAKLQYFRGVRAIKQSGTQEDPAEKTRLQSEAIDLWSLAAESFQEQIARDPDAAETPELRYLCAKSLQLVTQEMDRQLKGEKIANARKKIQQEMEQKLNDALLQLLTLRRDFSKLEKLGRLKPIDQTMLKDCYFEIGHLYFALSTVDSRHCEDANAAYLTAINKYPADLQIIPAYVRRMNCYRSRGRLAEARGMLEQAKVDLRRIPDDTFVQSRSELTRDDWLAWLNRLGP
jgi:tetratricopeptide (TPR) repeat protein